MMVLFFWLLVGHALADFPLQGDFLSRAKRADSGLPMPSWLALSTHSLIHAGVVALLTSSMWLGLSEFALHWSIDYAKCEGWLGGRYHRKEIWIDPAVEQRAFTIDQALHVVCKIAWAAIT
jgi:hypothetical protein